MKGFGIALLLTLIFLTSCGGKPVATPTTEFSQAVATQTVEITTPVWVGRVSAPVNTSPLVSGDLVIIPASDGSIHALDAGSGSSVWVYSGSKVWDASVNADDGKVCGGAEGGQVFCLDAATGKVLWSVTLDLDVQSRLALAGESVYAPTTRVGSGLANDFSAGASLTALDAKNGQMIWQSLTENYILRRPVVTQGLVITGGAYQPSDKPDGEVETRLYAFNLEDGSLVWEHRSDDGLMRWVDANEDTVFFSAASETVYALSLSDGKPLWNFGPGYWMQFPSFNGRTMYFGSGAELFHAVEIATGQEKWSHALDAASLNQVGRPVVQGNKIWFNSVIGEIYALNLETGERGAYLRSGHSVRVGGIVAGALYILGDAEGNIYAYQVE